MTRVIAVNAPLVTKNEIKEKRWGQDVQIIWTESFEKLIKAEADAYFDLAFENSRERVEALAELTRPVFIASVETPVEEINARFIRMNSWPRMLSRVTVELAAGISADPAAWQLVMKDLDWKYHVVPDIPGFISCRILASIINEAYHTLQAGVSSMSDIDTAMKLGTNYPLGPFEWAENIGIAPIVRLLTRMAIEDNRYMPAELLNNYFETGNSYPA